MFEEVFQLRTPWVKGFGVLNFFFFFFFFFEKLILADKLITKTGNQIKNIKLVRLIISVKKILINLERVNKKKST